MALSRWLAPAVLAAAFGAASFAPAPAHAQSYDLTRAIVDIADVVFRGNQPYYRNGDYSADDRLVMGRDAYGRPVYYRVVRDGRYDNYNNGYNGYNNAYRTGYTRSGPPYGRAYGYYGRAPGQVKCNKHGKCKTEYYDSRYDQHDRYDRYARDDRRWRDRDDD
jgi:hypothetical protein